VNAHRTIEGPENEDATQYAPNCMAIKVGQSAATFTFKTGGVLGFRCQKHPDRMLGAVWVLP
jgi:hypothetical protein